MTEYRYTIAVCHLDMVQTIEDALNSLIDTTDDCFEILVIDDGSTDGSLEVLERLANEYDRVRLHHGSNHNIAAARNSSIEHASGDVVFHQLDADDRYFHSLVDFATVYGALEDAFENEVYLRGRNVHVARKETLQRVPYRDVGYGEDLDLWRRMTADPDVAMVWLSHRDVRESIGYDRSLLEYARVRYSTAKVQFQTGIRPSSYAKCMLEELLPGGMDTRPWYGAVFHLLITLPAYLDARRSAVGWEEELPPQFRDYCWYRKHVRSAVTTLSALREEHGVDVSPADLEDPEVFFDDLPAPDDVIP